MPPGSHNHHLPPNPVQPTSMEQVYAQPTAPVTGTSPRSQSVSPRWEASSAPTSRAMNNTKWAEQNRKAQRVFRERRDACVISLYPCLYQSLQLANLLLFSNRSSPRHTTLLETPGCSLATSGGIESPLGRGRRGDGGTEEGKRSPSSNQANNPATLSSLTLPPHNPPPRQIPSMLHQQNGQSAEDPHPMLCQ